MDNKAIAKRIEYLYQNKTNLKSQRQLADICHIDAGNFNRMMNGKKSFPVGIIKKVANGLGVTYAQLVGDEPIDDTSIPQTMNVTQDTSAAQTKDYTELQKENEVMRKELEVIKERITKQEEEIMFYRNLLMQGKKG